MSDEISTDDLFGDTPPAPTDAPEPPKAGKPAARTRKPKSDPKPKREPVEIDNAVAIRVIDWECVCGNRNTHDLKQCGKCRDPRYTTT